MSTPVSYYCQKCLAVNPLNVEFCTRCGTRLMLVVEPAGAKFDGSEASVSSNEHLLERISSAENKLARLTERMEKSLDLLLRQAQNSYFDRSLVKSLIDLLSDDGLVHPGRLEKLWNERCQKDANEQEQTLRRNELRLSILAVSTGATNETFQQLVNQGFLLIDDQKLSDGIETLCRAAELAKANAPLLTFIGEHYFRSGETKLARGYLTKAHDCQPDNIHVILLLGLMCADDGESELAKTLLKEATDRGGSTFAGHCGLGLLLATEKKWTQALSEFKRALDTRPSPEAHYLLGAFYYQQRQDALALDHLQKAVEMDASYHEAFQLMALVYRRGGRNELADEALKKASSSLETNAGDEPLTKKRMPKLFPSTGRSRRLISGNDKRLAAALRADALRGFSRPTS